MGVRWQVAARRFRLRAESWRQMGQRELSHDRATDELRVVGN